MLKMSQFAKVSPCQTFPLYSMYVCIFACMYIYVCECLYLSMYLRMFACVYACMYAHYVCMHVYTYKFTMLDGGKV